VVSLPPLTKIIVRDVTMDACNKAMRRARDLRGMRQRSGGWVRHEKSRMGGHGFIYMSRERMDPWMKISREDKILGFRRSYKCIYKVKE
jgi:hypothetical protein